MPTFGDGGPTIPHLITTRYGQHPLLAASIAGNLWYQRMIVIAPGASEPASLSARRSARYHLLVKIADRRGSHIRGRVARIFRGNGKLRVGDEVEFDVPIRYDGPPGGVQPGHDSYGTGTTAAALRRARYVEAFVDREHGRCTLAADQYTLRFLGTRKPRLRVPTEEEVATAWRRFHELWPAPERDEFDDDLWASLDESHDPPIEVEMVVEIRDQDGRRSTYPSQYRGWLEVMKPGDFITLLHKDGGHLFIQGAASGPFLIRCSDASGRVLAEVTSIEHSATCRVIHRYIDDESAAVLSLLNA